MSGTEQITQEKRAELRKLHADATPGPYGFEAHGDTGSYSVGVIMDEYDDEPITGLNDDPTLFVVDVVASEVNGYQNAAFYAEAYNNFPQLLNALDAEETRANKLSSQLAKALEINAADQMEAAIKLFGGIVAAVSGEEMPQDLSVRVWLCPHCGTKHDSKEAAVAHDAICPKHPAVVRAEKAEAENARLRERLEAALDKIADIQENGEEEGACHACGICAGCPESWQPTDDHNCRVMLELWADGEPLPWEGTARRAVAESEVGE